MATTSYHKRLPLESKQIIDNIIKRYPKTKKRLKEYREHVLVSACHGNEWESDTERKGEKLSLPYMARMEREIKAVEAALEVLTDSERAIIEERYFKPVHKSAEIIAYEVGYGHTRASSIAARMRFLVAVYLGEISPEEADIVRNKTRRQQIQHSLELMARLAMA